MFGASEEIRIEHLQNNAMEFVSSLCGVISQPVEVVLRPGYGTRYVPPAIQFFAMVMMIAGPAFIMLFQNFMRMIPLLRVPPAIGMFSMADYARIYFLIAVIHGVRLWRRMLNPALEQHSAYEGPALPFFQLFPRGKSFWFVRVVLEPAFVLLVSVVLHDLFIIQADLSLYLKIAAVALLMKNFIAWFRAWEYLREMLDVRISAPILARLVENTATEEELAPMHLASFPKNIDPEIRKAVATQIARAYTPDKTNL